MLPASVLVAVMSCVVFWFVFTGAGHDVIADNDTNRVLCEQVATRGAADRAAQRLRAGLGEPFEVLVTERCAGYVVVVQYASTEEHRRADRALPGLGAARRHDGWFLDDVPVSLRNV